MVYGWYKSNIRVAYEWYMSGIRVVYEWCMSGIVIKQEHKSSYHLLTKCQEEFESRFFTSENISDRIKSLICCCD